MTQEDLLNFDKRINATLKGTMSIRASARAIGVKTDDLQYWIDNGVVPLTNKDDRLLKENVEILVEIRRRFIGLVEYAKSRENGLFNPKLIGHRNKLFDYLESNGFFGIKTIYADNLPILLPAREVLYFEREYVKILDEHCKDFFEEFGLTEKEKIQRLRDESLNEDIKEYIDVFLKLHDLNGTSPIPSETNAIKQISKIKRLTKIDKDYIQDSMNKAQTETEKSILNKFYNEIAKIKNLKYSRVALPARQEPIERKNRAYTYVEYCMLADILFHEDYIKKNKLVEKAIQTPLYAEKWLYLAVQYICSWRSGSICEDWQYLELDKQSPYIPIEADTLKEDLLQGRIKDEVFRKCIKYSITKLNAKCLHPKKTIAYDPTPLFIYGMPEDLERFFGRLLLICEAHHLQNPYDGYMKVNRVSEYQNWVSNRQFFGEDIYELFGKENITNTRLRSCFIQGTEITQREGGEDAISSISIAGFSCNHMSIATTQKYIRDHNLTGQTPEFIAYNLMQMGPLAALKDAAFKTGYADRYEALSVTDKSAVIKETGIDTGNLDLNVKVALLDDSFVKTLAEMNTPQTERVLNMMYEFGQHRGKAKDNGVYCILRGQKQECINPGCESCIAEMCEFCVFTEIGIKSVRKVIEDYVAKYKNTQNEKYRIMLNEYFLPWMTQILRPIVEQMNNGEKMVVQRILKGEKDNA